MRAQPLHAVADRFNMMMLIGAALLSIGILMMPVAAGVAVIGALLMGVATTFGPITLLVLMLALAPLRVLIATEAPGIPSDIGQMLMFIMFGVWVARHIAEASGLPSIWLSEVLILVSFFVLAVGASGFSALSLGSWAREWLKWIQITGLVLLISDVGRRGNWRWIVLGVVMAAAANAVVGIYQFFGGSGALHLLVDGQYFRAFGTFGQPNPFGGFMGLSAPLAIMGALAAALQLWQQRRLTTITVIECLLFGVTAGLIIVGIYMSYSRGAWLAFAASVGVMIFALPRRFWQSVALAAVGLGLITLAWWFQLIPVAIASRLSTITAEVFNVADVRGVDITPANYAIVERLAHWQAAIRMAEANPLLGVGAGNYEIAYDSYRLINWDEPLGHAHNYYLNVLAETGMIGFIAYLTMWIRLFWTTWRTRNHPDVSVRCIVIGLLGSWTYLMVHSLTDNLYVNNLFLHVGTLLGLLALFSQQQSHQQTLES